MNVSIDYYIFLFQLPPPPEEINKSNENVELPPTPEEINELNERSSFSNRKKNTWKKIQSENRKSKKGTSGKRKAESKVESPMPDSTSNYEVVCGERENTKLYAMDGYLYTINTVNCEGQASILKVSLTYSHHEQF